MVKRLYSLCAIIAAVCMFLMMMLTIADAVGRYAFNAPVNGAVEYIAYLLGLVVLPGYAMVTRDRSHIVVGMVADMLPSWYQRIEGIISSLLTLGLAGVLVWMTVRQAERFWRAGIAGDATHISVGGLVYVLAAFGVVAAVFALVNAYRVIVHAEKITPAGNHHTT